MVMQAWNQYGTIWPVVHQQLGVRPDLGRDELEVVPQVPPHEPSVGGENIRLGDGALRSVEASREGKRYVTEVDTGTAPLRRPDDRAHAAARRRAPAAVLPRRPPPPRAGAPDQPRRRGHGEDAAGRARPEVVAR